MNHSTMSIYASQCLLFTSNLSLCPKCKPQKCVILFSLELGLFFHTYYRTCISSIDVECVMLYFYSKTASNLIESNGRFCCTAFVRIILNSTRSFSFFFSRQSDIKTNTHRTDILTHTSDRSQSLMPLRKFVYYL